MSDRSGPPPAHAILEAAAVPILVLDRDYRFVYVNNAFVLSFGLTLDDLASRSLFEIFPEDEARIAEVRGRFEKVLQGRTTQAEAQSWRIADADGVLRERFWRASETPLYGPGGQVTHIVQSVEDVTAEAKLRRQNDIITRELEHRLSNTLTMIGSLAVITSRNAEGVDSFVDTFLERLQSVNRTLLMLSNNEWRGFSLRRILELELAQLAPPGDPRIRLEGPDYELSVRSTKWTALMVHELVTNAARYGCFSVPDGTLSVAWRAENAELVVDWVETGRNGRGDLDRKGFGTTMLTLMPNMKATRCFTETGMRLRISSPAGFIRPGLEQTHGRR